MSAGRQRLRRRRRRTGAALLGVLVLCAGVVSAVAVPTTGSAPVADRPVIPAAASDPGTVAFTDDTDHLVTLPHFGSNPHPTGFRSGTAHEGEASDNGDGLQAFVSTQDNPNGEVYLSDATASDGTGNAFPPTPVTCDDATKTHPVVSPDGSMVAFASNTSGQFQIYVVALPVIDVVHPDAPIDCTGVGTPVALANQTGRNLWPTWVNNTTLIYSSTRDNPIGDLYEQTITGTTTTRITNGVQSNGDEVANTQPDFDATQNAVYFTTTQFRADASIGFVLLNLALPASPTNAWLNADPPPQSSEADVGVYCPPGSTCLRGVAFTTTTVDPYGGIYFGEFEASVNTFDPSSIREVQDFPGVAESHAALLDIPSGSSDGVVVTERSIGANVSAVAADGSNRTTLISKPSGATPPSPLDSSKPAYSPDGTRLAYSQSTVSSAAIDEGDIPTRQIFITNADGSGTPTPIGPFDQNPNEFDIDTAPAWSPDGTEIAFSRMIVEPSDDESDNAVSQEIWVVNVADPSNAHPLDVPGRGTFFDSAPSWSPDGQRIVISRVPESTDLDLDLNSFPNPVEPGVPITIDAFLSNFTPGIARDLVLTLDFPAGLTPTALPSGCAFGTSSQQVVCRQDELAAGDFSDYRITAIGALAPGSESTPYTVTGTVTSSTPENDPSDNTDSTTVTVSRESDLGVAMSMPSSAAPGSAVDVAVTASNSGPDTADNVSVTVTFSITPSSFGALPGGCFRSGDSVVCTLSSLGSGASPTFHIPVRWDGSCASAETVHVTSSITSSTPDANSSNNSDAKDISIGHAVCIHVAPRAAPQPAHAFAPHRLMLPSVVGSQPLAVNNAAGTRGVTFLGAPGPPELWIVDATNGTGEVLPPPTPCGADCAIGGAEPAWSPDDLHIAFETGGQIEVATLADSDNDGVADVPESTTSQTPLTGYRTYSSGGGGQPTSSYPTISGAHDPTWWPDGSKILFAGQPAGQPDNLGIYLINADGTGLQALAQEPQPESEPSVRGFADLSLALAPPMQSVFPNQDATITATVTNNGPSRAAAPTVTFTVDPGLTIVSATPVSPPPGGSCTVAAQTVTCTLPAVAAKDSESVDLAVRSSTPSAATGYAVSGTVESDTNDPTISNNTAAASVVVRHFADLSVMITASATPIFNGDSTTITAVVQNGAGSPSDFSPAENTVVTVSVPPQFGDPTNISPSGCTFTENATPPSPPGGTLTCPLGTLAPTASQTISFDTQSTAPGSFDFTATATTDTPESDTTNNTDTTTVRVLPRTGVSVAISATPTTLPSGTTTQVTTVVTNGGPDASENTTLTVVIPTGMDPPTSVPLPCTISANTITCSYGTVPKGDSRTLTFTSRGVASGPHTFTANVTTTTEDSDTSDNSASVTVKVTDSDVAVAITIPSVAYVGGSTSAKVFFANHGPAAAVDVHLQVFVGSRLTATATPACHAGTGVCDLGTLAPGAHGSFTIALVPTRLHPATSYRALIAAHITTTTPESTLANNKARALLPVKQPTLRLLPPIGPPGFVTLAFGENLPPGAIVTLRWRQGITTFDGPYRVAPDGTVEAPMLVVRRDELGERQAVLRGKPGRFGAVQANMLVVPNTEQPPRFLGRG